MTPEDPPPLKKIKLGNDVDENLKPGLTLEVLDNEPGFYQSTMRSMLLPGHEGELCTYLKEMGLIQRSVRCQGSEKLPNCNSQMKWTQARIVDKYQWKCDECKSKCSIREDSFFKQTKCSLMSAIRVLLSWCKDVDPEDVATVLHLKIHLIRKLYDTCSHIIEEYVNLKSNEWKIGGENSIVMVDVYPEGCAQRISVRPEFQNNNPIQILCFAEAKTFPTQYWFHVLSSVNVEVARKEGIEVVRSMVKPGSILVADSNSKVCSYSDLLAMKEYPKVVNIEQLMKHNRPNYTILQNLGTIWEPAITICNEAQSYPQQLVQPFLYNQLWRRKFAKTPSSALEYFLHHIADQSPLMQS